MAPFAQPDRHSRWSCEANRIRERGHDALLETRAADGPSQAVQWVVLPPSHFHTRRAGATPNLERIVIRSAPGLRRRKERPWLAKTRAARRARRPRRASR